MTIMPRLVLSGDRHRAAMLRRQALKQLDTLDLALSRQNLMQGISRDITDEGDEIITQRHGTLSTVHINSPIRGRGLEPVRREYPKCWCYCCYTTGKIIEIIGLPGDTGTVWFGDVQASDIPNAQNLDAYDGIRYKISVCQKRRDIDDGEEFYIYSDTNQYVCAATDWNWYSVDDTVLLGVLGNWSDEGFSIAGTCRQCGRSEYCDDDQMGNCRDGALEALKLDGKYVILPFRVEGVTEIA